MVRQFSASPQTTDSGQGGLGGIDGVLGLLIAYVPLLVLAVKYHADELEKRT